MAAEPEPEITAEMAAERTPDELLHELRDGLGELVFPSLARFMDGKPRLIADPLVHRGIEAFLITHGYLEATEEYDPEQPMITGVRISEQGKGLLEKMRGTAAYLKLYGPGHEGRDGPRQLFSNRLDDNGAKTPAPAPGAGKNNNHLCYAVANLLMKQ